MEQRILGRTGLSVSALALGTVELGMDYGIQAPGHFGRPSVDESRRLVHAALDNGVNFIDTARDYGESEAVLGRALSGRRHEVVIATKANPAPIEGEVPTGDALADQLLATLETSLRQLRTDYVDLWMMHSMTPELMAQNEALASAFDRAKSAGKIRSSGASFYGETLPLSGVESGLFDAIQVTYSVLDQRIEDQLLPAAQAHNVGVMVRSVLLKGALTDRADHLPPHLHELTARSQQFRQLVATSGTGLSAAQIAVAFGLTQPQISAVLIGVRTQKELEENLQAADASLSSELYEQLQSLRLDDEDLLNPGTWGIP